MSENLELIIKVKKRIETAYYDYALDGDFSPSPSDLVAYAAEVMGRGYDRNSAGFEILADRAFEAMCNGADTTEVAGILVKGLNA